VRRSRLKEKVNRRTPDKLRWQ